MSPLWIGAVVLGGLVVVAALVRALRQGQADPLVDAGRALTKEGKHDQARDMFAKAIEINPRHRQAWANLALALADLGRYGEACEKLSRALDLGVPDMWGTMEEMIQLREMCEKYAKAIECDPGAAGVYCCWGVDLARKGRHAQAREKYGKAASVDPQHAGAHYLLGGELKALGRYGEAREKFVRAAEINPHYPFDNTHHFTCPPLKGSMVRAAEATVGYKLPKSYIDLLSTKNGGSLKRNCFPTDHAPEGYIEVACIRGIGGEWAIDFDAAGSRRMGRRWHYPDIGVVVADTPTPDRDALMLDYSVRGPEGEPRVVHVVNGAGEAQVVAPDFETLLRSLVGSGEYQYAVNLPEYAEALEADPRDGMAHYCWGVALAALGRHMEARDRLAEAVELLPRDAAAHRSLALAMVELGQHAEACEQFAKAIELEPRDAETLHNWGSALTELDRHAEACDKYAAAIGLSPQFAHACYRWGEALSSLDRHAEACEKYAQAIQIDARHAEAYGEWGAALIGMGKPVQAARASPQFGEGRRESDYLVEAAGQALLGGTLWGLATGKPPSAFLDDLTSPGEGTAQMQPTRHRLHQVRQCDFASVVEIDRRDALAYLGWGTALAEMSRGGEAEEKWSRAIELNPRLARQIEEIRKQSLGKG